MNINYGECLGTLSPFIPLPLTKGKGELMKRGYTPLKHLAITQQ